MTKLILSNRLNVLVKSLVEELDGDALHPLQPRTILLPNQKLKQWLMLSLATLGKSQAIAGCRVLSVERAMFSQSPNAIDLFSAIYSWLQNSHDPELLGYLEGKPKRSLELAEKLSSLVKNYGKFGNEIWDGKRNDWQSRMLRDLFVTGPWRLIPSLSIEGPIHCFGCDFLPPIYWELLSKQASVSIYLFSPCIHFWEDLCTHWEKKKLIEKSSSIAVRRDLESYLKEAPPLLANWGKLGRETMKILDSIDLDLDERYSEMGSDSALQTVRSHLLLFERPIEKREADPNDDSIAVYQTGSSRWREIEILRENIERLAEKGVYYSEMEVLAPNIDPYIPLIEFVFGNEIPYRIQDVEISSKSHFLQGIRRLLSFSDESLLALFETPSFYRKFNWDGAKLEQIREWVEEGIDSVLDSLLRETDRDVAWSDADLLEEVVFLIESLKMDLKTDARTWLQWADFLENLAEKYLVSDEIGKSAFEKLVMEIRSTRVEGDFSIEVLRHILDRPVSGAIHPHSLHAVRFASLQPGSVLPARALFLIGMDEEAFPRKESPTSLDLLKEEKIYIPRSGDVDRYLMLQALFAAEEFLYFSYGHLSSEEGKPIAPSLALQELLTDIDAHFEGGKWLHTAPYLKTYPEQKGLGDFFGIHETFPELPQGEVTLYLSDLVKLARHPCDFYLQKKLGIYVEKSPFDSFPAQKSYLARESLQEPFEAVAQTHREKFAPGLVGTAQKLEIEELIHNWEEQLSDWNLKLSVWSMLATCKEKSEVSSQLVEIPPITLQINDHLLVKIVGDLKTMSERGFVSTSDELLKIWPEALVSAIVSKSPEIFLLKKGKIIEMHEPEEKLRLFVIYYFRALAQASPLITNWADFILNGGKMEKSRFEDSVADWVLSRITLPKEEELLAKWGWLKEVFQHAAL